MTPAATFIAEHTASDVSVTVAALEARDAAIALEAKRELLKELAILAESKRNYLYSENIGAAFIDTWNDFHQWWRVMALPRVLVQHPHVRCDVNVLNGSPYILGSRVPVRRLYSFYLAGASVDHIVKRYPQLDRAKVFDALSFALDNEELMHADIYGEDLILKGGA